MLRAVLMAGAYPALIALIGLGLGAVTRHTAGAICAVVGVLFVLPLLFIPLGTSIQNAVVKFLPEPMAANSLTVVKPVANTLSPWVSFGLLCGYAVVALAAGCWALGGRDASNCGIALCSARTSGQLRRCSWGQRTVIMWRVGTSAPPISWRVPQIRTDRADVHGPALLSH